MLEDKLQSTAITDFMYMRDCLKITMKILRLLAFTLPAVKLYGKLNKMATKLSSNCYVMNNTLSTRENVRCLSILLLAILGLLNPGKLQFLLLLSWISINLIVGNVRHLPYNNKLTYFVRMTLYFLPFALLPIIFGEISLKLNVSILLFSTVAIVVFCVWFLINYKSIRLMLSSAVIANTQKESRYVIALRIYNAIGSTISEELFFRAFILSIPLPLWITIPISTIYFMLSHYIVPWGDRFSRSDIVNQLIFGLISSVLFVLSGSIIPSIVLHLLLNYPTLDRMVRVYVRHYIRTAWYDKLLSKKDRFDELSL